MTSVDQGKLYLAGLTGDGAGKMNVLLWPATVNKTAGTVTIHQSSIVDSGLSNLIPELPNFGMARVGRSGTSDVVITAAPFVTGSPASQGMRVRRIAIDTTATGVNSVSASTFGTVLAPTAFASTIEPTLVEGPPGNPMSFLYWRELLDSRNLATTSVRVRGVALRPSTTSSAVRISSVVDISRDASGASRSWTGFPASRGTGDYIYSGSFGSPARFLTQWTETAGAWVQHASIVTVPDP